MLSKHKPVIHLQESCKSTSAGMVDDVLNVAKCSEQAVLSNSTNTFMEQNKLKLAAGKCSRVHVGKKVDKCYDLIVCDEEMKDSDTENYLGDFIGSD